MQQYYSYISQIDFQLKNEWCFNSKNCFSILVWSLAATGFHFLLDEKTKQKNHVAKKAMLRMQLPPPTV